MIKKGTIIRLCACILIAAMSLPLFTFVVTALDEDISSAVKNTGLPVVCIDINDGSSITDRETYKAAKMHITLTNEYAEYTNEYTEEGGADLEIKGRGNSSWWQFSTQKRAFNIKLDKKTELFGMDNSKKWCLIANFMDRSNLRNKLAYELSGRMGMTYCESVFVNLYLNGNYMGVYMLCERVDVDEEIYEWEDVAEDAAKAIRKGAGLTKDQGNILEDAMKEDLSWITEDTVEFLGVTYTVSDYYDYSEYSLCGGYLIEYDHYYDQISKFFTANGVPINLQSPEYLESNDTLMTYLQQLFADFEEALWSETFYNSKGHHYSEYVDMDSLVDFFIVNALFLNVEFGYKSNYMYIDETGIITFGPVWDFDWSSGNHFLGSSAAYDKWYGGDWRTQHNVWYHQLYGDPYFTSLVQERWFELQDTVQDMIDSIDDYYAYLNAASTYELNHYLSLPSENDFQNQYHGYSYKAECDALKSFLVNRFNWMNNQLRAGKPSIEDKGAEIETRMSITLQGDKVSSSVSASGFSIDYSLNAEYTDSIGMSFALESTSGAANRFEIYVNENYYASFESLSFVTELPCELFRDGINTVSVVRVRNGEYSGTRAYVTVKAKISGRRVEKEALKISPAEITYVEKTTLVQKLSDWKIYVTNNNGFDRINNSNWTSLSYNERNWKSFTAPMGDRLVPANADASGWKGDNHVLFARKKFDVDLSRLDADQLCMDIYYDNTLYLYLNGHLIYSDDNAQTGKNDWTDSYVLINLADAAQYLVNGENILAVSLQNKTGGREFDMELFATVTDEEKNYKNPAADLTVDETVLEKQEDEIRTFVTVSKEKDGMGVFLLADKEILDAFASGVLSVTLNSSGKGKTVSGRISQLEELKGITADSDSFVPDGDSRLLVMTVDGIDKISWDSVTVKLIRNGSIVFERTLSYKTLMSHYTQ